jgi:hypothetical protein
MLVDLSQYEKAVGPLYACQLSLKLFIENSSNSVSSREYAKNIYIWLGPLEADIDELCSIDYSKSVFILKTLEKYIIDTKNYRLLEYYTNAVESLKYQIKYLKLKKK